MRPARDETASRALQIRAGWPRRRPPARRTAKARERLRIPRRPNLRAARPGGRARSPGRRGIQTRESLMQHRSGVALSWLTSVWLLGCGGGAGPSDGNGPTLFFPAVGVTLGDATEPASTVVADVDQDGRPDVVTVERGRAAFAVLLGDGTGGVAGTLVQPLGVGVDAAALVVALLDADGRPDVAIADAAGEAVLVFRGTGGGTFSPIFTAPLRPGSGASAIVAADLDADGAVDLAVADK